MKVLITGITGFVGSHLADYILAEHPEVKIFGLKRWRSPKENIEGILDKLNLVDGDLRDLKSIIEIMMKIKPDIIFHLAAQSYVPASYLSPIDTFDINAIGTLNLLEGVRFAKINPVIHICSSSEVYGQVDEKDVPITEDCPFRPVSPYGVSKLSEDMIAYQYFIAYKIKTIRTRMFTHTGPRRGEVFAVSAFAKQVAAIECSRQEPIIRVGNLNSVRTFADVRDTVRAYWLLVEKCPPGEVYNIGGNRTMEIGEMLDTLLSFSSVKGIKTQVDPLLLRPADVTLQIPSIEKFQKAVNWEPVIPFEKTLEDTLNYWREKYTRHPVTPIK